MNSIDYNGHSTRYEDVGKTRYVGLQDIADLFADHDGPVIPMMHPAFATGRFYIDGYQVIRLDVARQLFPFAQELSDVLANTAAPIVPEFAGEHGRELFEDFRMTVEEVTGFLTDEFCDYINGGSSEQLIKRLGDTLSCLEAIEMELYANYC